MAYKIIACINKKNAIGKNGNLLYHINNDMQNFKSMTIGEVVIMGRKTFESLPNKRPLVNRVNIILTNDENYNVEIKQGDNVYVVHSIDEAMDICETCYPLNDWFIIGGYSIYNAFLSNGIVDEMRITKVEDDSDGDSIFPRFDACEWRVYYKSLTQHDEKTNKNYTFMVLKKNA